MGLLGWMASIGGLMLAMSLASGWIRDLPVTTFLPYLAAGVVAGPWVLDLLHVDVVANASVLATVTKVALVVSLFLTGLKLRLRFRDPDWRTARGGRLAAHGYSPRPSKRLSMFLVKNFLIRLPMLAGNLTGLAAQLRGRRAA